MPHNRLVRASRDGDQFHYLWAARRCLPLLSPASGLVAITIEGISPRENPAGRGRKGEEVIDVAEYYGNEDPTLATSIRYIQLKHSTERSDDSWTPSGLKKTIKSFAAYYKTLIGQFTPDFVAERFEFHFISNRPVAINVLDTITDLATEMPPRHPLVRKKLAQFTAMAGPCLAHFCSLLRVEGGHDNYWVQRQILKQELSGYLPGDDRDAPMELKELVTRKALSESSDNPRITKVDVLRALGSDEAELFPSPCRIERVQNLIPREQEPELMQEILSAGAAPIIIHAAGGVGKSILQLGSDSYCLADPNVFSMIASATANTVTPQAIAIDTGRLWFRSATN